MMRRWCANVQDSSASSQIDSVRFLQRLISVFRGRFFSSLAFSLQSAQFLCEDLLTSRFSAGCDLGFAAKSISLENLVLSGVPFLLLHLIEREWTGGGQQLVQFRSMTSQIESKKMCARVFRVFLFAAVRRVGKRRKSLKIVT